MVYVIIFIIVFIIYIVWSKHLYIDFKSFFRRGFKKVDNAFRRLLLYAVNSGKGKTYSCINSLIKLKVSNPDLVIITNVHSFKVFNDTIFFDNFIDIMNYCINNLDLPLNERKQVIIFYDEIFTLLEKNKHINKDILSFLSQLRKRQICLYTTAQEWLEINVTFRRYVRYQVDCNMISLPLTKTAILINAINDGDLLKWDNELNEYVAPRISTKIFKGNRSVIESYDTFETITTN